MRTIQTYESGQVEPPEDFLDKIAAVFGTTPCALLDKYGQSAESIPAHFNGDVDKYENFKKAVDQDYENEEGLKAITEIYEKLNQDGKYEAYKRISELAELAKYTKRKEPRKIMTRIPIPCKNCGADLPSVWEGKYKGVGTTSKCKSCNTNHRISFDSDGNVSRCKIIK